MSELPSVPAGYVPHTRRSGLTAPWEPIYAKPTEAAVLLGLRAGPAHANSRGIAHGGLLTALADNAMGLSCEVRLGGGARLVTVSLSIDFLSAAKLGQWIEVDTVFVKTGKRLCFAQAFVLADTRPVRRPRERLGRLSRAHPDLPLSARRRLAAAEPVRRHLPGAVLWMPQAMARAHSTAAIG